MKEYNREKKMWEEPNKKGSLKKRETCRGGKPHDYVLVVPSYIKRDHDLSKDEVAEYYKIEAKRDELNRVLDDQLNSLGIKSRNWFGVKARAYICSVCLKYIYE